MRYTLDTWRSGTERRGLSVATAAGLLADWETILVGAVATEDSNWQEKGEASPALTMVLWGNPLAGEEGEPRFVMRWASGSPVPPGSGEVLAMHQVITHAGRIAALAEKLRDGEDGLAVEDSEPADRTAAVVTEVAIALGRYAELHPDPVTLTHEQALRLARHAMDRLCLIRDRDGGDPLPHAEVPATNPRYDPLVHLVVIALDAARSPAGRSTPAVMGLTSLSRVLDLDGAATLETWLARIRAALAGERAQLAPVEDVPEAGDGPDIDEED